MSTIERDLGNEDTDDGGGQFWSGAARRHEWWLQPHLPVTSELKHHIDDIHLAHTLQ